MTKEGTPQYILFDIQVKANEKQGKTREEAIKEAREFFSLQVYLWWKQAEEAGLIDAYFKRVR